MFRHYRVILRELFKLHKYFKCSFWQYNLQLRCFTLVLCKFSYENLHRHMKLKTNRCHYFNFIHISTDLYTFRAHRPILRRIHTAVHTTFGSVVVPFGPRRERYSHWTNGCVNCCVNFPADGPVGPKRVEIRRYMNKIEIVTSVGFSFHTLKWCTVQKA
jgi:hypothetical protein